MRGLVFIISLIAVPGFAQTEHKPSVHKQQKEDAQRYINELKDGVLLIRLATAEHKAQSLREEGNERDALLAEKDVEMQNKVLISSFQRKFKFCPVFFFLPEDSEHVTAGSWDNVRFVDQELRPDTARPDLNAKVYVAEIATIEQDTTKIFEGYYYHQGENGLERRERYSGGSGITFEALVMKNDEFVQLTDPFPYYVRTYGDLPVGQDIPKVVAKLNKRLVKYYKKNVEVTSD